MTKITIDSWAWVDRSELTLTQIQAIKASLTVIPRKVGDYPGEPPDPLKLYTERDGKIGMAREYFFSSPRAASGKYQLDYQVTEGNKTWWPGDEGLRFAGTLRDEQTRARDKVVSSFRANQLGGIIRAVPGFGKTVCACAIIAELKVPTLVVVHKEFLVDQWMKRMVLGEKGIPPFLPDAKVGTVQQDRCEYRGNHIAIAMIHSLVDEGRYPPEFYDWPGLVILDETHRVGASTWSRVPPHFRAKWRLGLSATPRRKDGAENVFFYHLGPILFSSAEKRLTPKVRRVWTKFHLVKTEYLNPSLVRKSLMLKFLCANKPRNTIITEQLVLAAKAGRKVLVVSERLEHLKVLNAMLRKAWKDEDGPPPSTGSYVGGQSQVTLDRAAEAQVIFATAQFVVEGLDIPALDTLFLTTPLGDIEQASGRILRPYEGKKEPVIVDFRDDYVGLCKSLGDIRDRQYAQIAS